MKQITNSKGAFCAVISREADAFNFSIHENFLFYEYLCSQGYITTNITLPKGNWQILGKAADILNSEELAKKVVERHYKWDGYKTYDKYADEIQWHETAIHSFASFMTANSISETDLLLIKI